MGRLISFEDINLNTMSYKDIVQWIEQLPDTRSGVDQLMGFINQYELPEAYVRFLEWTDFPEKNRIGALAITPEEKVFVVHEICKNLSAEFIQASCLNATCDDTILREFEKYGYHTEE